MALPEHVHDQDCLQGLTDIATSMGVTRAAVNFMVRDGRLKGTRHGPRWYVCQHDLATFVKSYQRPPSAGRKLGPRDGSPDMVDVVYSLLVNWGETRVDELSEVVARDPGNVRKYLAILRARGLAQKSGPITWVATSDSRSLRTTS